MSFALVRSAGRAAGLELEKLTCTASILDTTGSDCPNPVTRPPALSVLPGIGAGDGHSAACAVADVRPQVARAAAPRDRVQVAAVGQRDAAADQAVPAGGIAEGQDLTGAAGADALKESAKKGGKIKFARSGATTNPLIVNLGVDGTGIDFGFLPGTITIPAKMKSATLVVVPFADGLVEPPETIELTVLPGDGYQTTSTPTATITLLSTEKKPKK
jgi:hypothetical protein